MKALLTQSKNNVHSVADILLTGTVMRNVVSLQLLALYNQYLLSYITRKEEDISYVMTTVYIHPLILGTHTHKQEYIMS